MSLANFAMAHSTPCALKVWFFLYPTCFQVVSIGDMCGIALIPSKGDDMWEGIFSSRALPQASSGSEYDKKKIKELYAKLTGALHNICKNNLPAAQPTPKDTKADLIYKRVVCNFI